MTVAEMEIQARADRDEIRQLKSSEALHLEIITSLEAQRDGLRAEVERLREEGERALGAGMEASISYNKALARAERAEAALRAKCAEYRMHDAGFCPSGACDMARAVLAGEGKS